ncbi:MAG: zinc ribbon domain-containing protein [Nitrospirae bacterium]|nr:MAG: zinc ribbon domain-containing protein [Nitrospirota bacterium]
MPLYEYICNHCKKSFTLLQRVGASERETRCIYCGSSDVKKKLSTFSSIGGGGFFGGFPSGGA